MLPRRFALSPSSSTGLSFLFPPIFRESLSSPPSAASANSASPPVLSSDPPHSSTSSTTTETVETGVHGASPSFRHTAGVIGFEVDAKLYTLPLLGEGQDALGAGVCACVVEGGVIGRKSGKFPVSDRKLGVWRTDIRIAILSPNAFDVWPIEDPHVPQNRRVTRGQRSPGARETTYRHCQTQHGSCTDVCRL